MVRVSLITRKLFFLLYHAQSRGRPPDHDEYQKGLKRLLRDLKSEAIKDRA